MSDLASPSPAFPEPGPSIRARVLGAFPERFGAPPSVLVRAPGRVNLLGEHTDYNQGLVLPMALDRSVWIAARARDDDRVLLHSLDFDEERSFDLRRLGRDSGWIEYVKGTAWALSEAGYRVRGFEGVLGGEIPMGAGLSSSAALEVASARTLAALSGIAWDPLAAAGWCQHAENGWVGVHCGIMDPLIVAAGRQDQALLIDCQTLETRGVPLPAGTAVVVLDTSTRRGLVASGYNDRRAGCEEAARRLGVTTLRAVSIEDVERRWTELPEPYRNLARHVVTENARTLAAAEAMAADEPREVGRLMLESHRSLRDDFRVSSDALDAMALSAHEADGCYGARMTGAGFAGCAVALVDATRTREFVAAVQRSYRARTGLQAAAYVCRPSAGADIQHLD